MKTKPNYKLFNTRLQGIVYDHIKVMPGDDPKWLAMNCGISPQSFGKVAHALMRAGHVYYYNGPEHREWYVTKE